MNVDDSCVLLFSGGRDSTLAAVRLAKQFRRLVLVTVASAHMTGLDHVHARIKELKQVIPVSCQWILLPEAPHLTSDQATSHYGCISCHFGYFWCASRIADQIGGRSIACGFVEYQKHWIEQTPYAIRQLSDSLKERGQHLLLPVADVQSKAQAEAELRSHGLTTQSLELKCLRQRVDPGLVGTALSSAVDAWTDSLRALLANDSTLGSPIDQEFICGERLP
jgi:hypothetical protein